MDTTYARLHANLAAEGSTAAAVATALAHISDALPPAAFPVLARELADWLISLEHDTPARQRVSMNTIIEAARFVLGRPEDGAAKPERAAALRAAHRAAGTTPLLELTLTLVTLDDVRAVDLRRTTGLRDIISWARQALADTPMLRRPPRCCGRCFTPVARERATLATG